MKLFNIYIENKGLIKENTKLKTKLKELDRVHTQESGQRSLLLSKIDFYTSKIERNEEIQQDLRYKVNKLLHENTELLEERNKISKDKSIAKSIATFIEELEHNKKIDKNNNIYTSVVTCDYVIERLNDIIK